MLSHTFRARFGFGLLLTLLALMPLGTARSQGLNEGMNELEAAYRRYRNTFPDLLRGKTQAEKGNRTHVDALDAVAKYHTFRVYLDHLETPDPKKPGNRTLDRAFTEFERDLSDVEKGRPMTQAAAEIFRDKVREHAEEVINFEKAAPVHKIFNARVLAEIARLGQPKLAETLVGILKNDKQNDGVHFYALRGMRNLLAAAPSAKDQQKMCAEALIDFLEHRQGPPKGAPKDEIDGFRVLRREAIRALAQVRTPEVSPKAQPALVLARFAGADGRIQPEPRIDERVEAAIGLARMASAQDKRYQAAYAANQIGRCLGTFAQKFNEERANTERGGVEPSRPWKIDAYRLNEALTALKADSGKNAYVGSVIDRGARVLQEVMKGNQPNADDLTWFASPDSDAPNKELFQGAADSTVQPAKPAEAQPEKEK